MRLALFGGGDSKIAVDHGLGSRVLFAPLGMESQVLQNTYGNANSHQPALGAAHRFLWSCLLFALLCSGGAGIVNQVAWQRGLKVFLGGSESLSTMTVVLVFLGGLGLGAGWASRGTRDSSFNPARRLAKIEAALCVLNLVIAWLLSLDLSESVYAMQRTALMAGMPLRALYAFGATSMLGLPCFLMGMTFPLASDVCQRQLGGRQPSWIARLCFVNTLGAVAGALVSGLWLLPHLGQFVTLLIAAAGNGLAAVCVSAVVVSLRGRQEDTEQFKRRDLVYNATSVPSRSEGRQWLTQTDWAGFALGLLALGYEMYLFRLLTLLYWPLPETFAVGLAAYLCLWSLGVFRASFSRHDTLRNSVLCGLLIAAMPFVYNWHRWGLVKPEQQYWLGIVYCLPCYFFGELYGRLVAQSKSDWGQDCGRFQAMNTLGACLGTLLFTLVGYEIDQDWNARIIALGLLGVTIWMFVPDVNLRGGTAFARFRSLIAGISLASIPVCLVQAWQSSATVQANGVTSYYGRDGVVEIRSDGGMIWDGLEHSCLRRGDRHIGDNNWLMATIPVLCHPGPQLEDALVIGLGCGTTAHTLAGIERLKNIDVYDINTTLRRLLTTDPQGTFRVGETPKIQISWGDGRTGLALHSQKYDLITQQPLYLIQAGSGLLLSKEYLELVRSRLKSGGVFCAYTYDLENPALSQVVRQTFHAVFKHCESFSNGWMIVASDSPLSISDTAWERRLHHRDRFSAEVRQFEQAAELLGRKSLLALHDSPRLSWDATPHVVSDDHPLVEYPNVTKNLLLRTLVEGSDEETNGQKIQPVEYRKPAHGDF